MRGYGSLTVICGPMFSGKSSLLAGKIMASSLDASRRLVLKPVYDTRDPPNVMTWRGGKAIQARTVAAWPDVGPEVEVIYIDEVQFFVPGSFAGDLPAEIGRCLERGIHVVVSGLDLASSGKPFSVTGNLLAMADEVIKLTARCDFCGAPASKTFRADDGAPVLKVGSAEIYSAACNECFSARRGRLAA